MKLLRVIVACACMVGTWTALSAYVPVAQQPRDAKAKAPAPKPTPSTLLSMKAADWQKNSPDLFPSCVTGKVTQNANGVGWYQVFPADGPCPNGANSSHIAALDWLAVNYTGDLRAKTSITFLAQAIVLTGTPAFNFHDIEPGNLGTSPPTMRTILEATSTPVFEDNRWFCHTAYPLDSFTAMVVTCQLPGSSSFSGQEWSNIYGHYATDRLPQFLYALAHLRTVGLCFGGWRLLLPRGEHGGWHCAGCADGRRRAIKGICRPPTAI